MESTTINHCLLLVRELEEKALQSNEVNPLSELELALCCMAHHYKNELVAHSNTRELLNQSYESLKNKERFRV